MGKPRERGASTVIGILLLVGVAVVVGSVVAVGALTFLDGLGTPQATADFSYERTAAGLEMTPEAISTAVSVQLNGREVATFQPRDAGQSVLLPTAPGDRITVVSRDGEQSVLVQEEIDERSEIGDFIAYYTFEGADGDTTLEDQSGNDNDGTLESVDDEEAWTGNSYDFDGADYFSVSDIEVPGTGVDEFTIAVAFKQDEPGGSDDVSQLVEHQYGGNEWFLETRDTGSNTYEIDYAVEFDDEQVSSGTDYGLGERHVAVGTYDGSEYDLYVDGTRVGGGTHDDTVGTDEMHIGRDFESDIQYFDGEMYEIRLYYTAFDGEQVQVITNAME